ncbi:MAG: O-antigen ligase family protein [Alphaproteobacteria bacterium]|nr:O-antigen ligase family protein [Alphaproteobacteria bacterium]
MIRRTLKDQRDRASRYLLYGLFILLPLTAVFGHRGIAPWLLLASLPAFARGDFWQSAFGILFDKPNLRDPFFAGFLAIAGFCLWIFISGFWSPKHHYTLFLNVAAPILVGGSVIWYALNLPRLWTYRLATAFALAITGGMFVLALEGVTDGFLRDILPPNDPSADGSRDIIALGRGVTALVPALFPAALIVSMIWSRAAALGLLALGVVAAFSNDVAANAVAIGAGFTAAIIAFKAPLTSLRVAAIGVIALLVFTPIAAALIPVEAVFDAVNAQMPDYMQSQFSSWFHRLAVWKSVASHIIEGLPFGYGADYARVWKETADFVQVPGAAIPLSLMPTHPHNVFLQIWLELGLPGVAAFGLFIHFGGTVLRRANLPVPNVAAIIGALAAITVSVLVEGSLWQVWRLAAMALAGMGIALSYSLHRQWKA